MDGRLRTPSLSQLAGRSCDETSLSPLNLPEARQTHDTEQKQIFRLRSNNCRSKTASFVGFKKDAEKRAAVRTIFPALTSSQHEEQCSVAIPSESPRQQRLLSEIALAVPKARAVNSGSTCKRTGQNDTKETSASASIAQAKDFGRKKSLSLTPSSYGNIAISHRKHCQPSSRTVNFIKFSQARNEKKNQRGFIENTQHLPTISDIISPLQPAKESRPFIITYNVKRDEEAARKKNNNLASKPKCTKKNSVRRISILATSSDVTYSVQPTNKSRPFVTANNVSDEVAFHKKKEDTASKLIKCTAKKPVRRNGISERGNIYYRDLQITRSCGTKSPKIFDAKTRSAKYYKEGESPVCYLDHKQEEKRKEMHTHISLPQEKCSVSPKKKCDLKENIRSRDMKKKSKFSMHNEGSSTTKAQRRASDMASRLMQVKKDKSIFGKCNPISTRRNAICAANIPEEFFANRSRFELLFVKHIFGESKVIAPYS